VAQLVEALCHKSEGRKSDSRLFFRPSKALSLTQSLTEMSARKSPGCGGGVKAAGAGADNLITFMCRLSVNLGPSGPVQACM